MAKTTLVAGKDMPAGSKFADGMNAAGRQVVITGPDADMRAEGGGRRRLAKAGGLVTLGWNKASPLSSRTLVLNTENVFGQMDEAVLYFDEDAFAFHTNHVGIEECSAGCDQMILSYQYLTLEVLGRFERKNSEERPGSLVFLLKEGPCAADTVRVPSLRNGAYSVASPVVAAAAAAFTVFAENIVALYGDMPYVNILLVRGEPANDATLAKWLCGYLDSLAESRTALSAKRSLQWVKPGTRPQAGGFSLFGKKG